MIENVAVDIADAGSWKVNADTGARPRLDAIDVVRGRAGLTVGGELAVPAFASPDDTERAPSPTNAPREPALFRPRSIGAPCSGASSRNGSYGPLRTVLTDAAEMRRLRLRASATSRSSDRCPWCVNCGCSEGCESADAAASRTGKGLRLHI